MTREAADVGSLYLTSVQNSVVHVFAIDINCNLKVVGFVWIDSIETTFDDELRATTCFDKLADSFAARTIVHSRFIFIIVLDQWFSVNENLNFQARDTIDYSHCASDKPARAKSG